MNIIFQIIKGVIKGTPFWVWAIFAFLLYRGIRALKTRVVPLKKIFILPAIFISLALYRLVSSNGAIALQNLWWFFAFVTGVSLGFLLFKSTKIQADKKKYLIKLPGTLSTLIMILIIFGIKFCFGYISALNSVFAKSLMFLHLKLITSGMISGLTLGRSLLYFVKHKNSKHTNLSEKQN